MEVQEALAEHTAKEQEEKKNGGDESNGNDEVNLDANKKIDGEGMSTYAKADGTTNGKQSEPYSTPIHADTDSKSEIDTAVGVTESVDIKAKAESKEPEGGEEDDEFMFEMDEDTFHFYQQAEQEAEGRAVEAQSKAIGRFCNLIFQAILASLFVAKLNQFNPLFI